MKKLVMIILCLLPVLSSASGVSSKKNIELIQEQCAKEKDPVKRQNSCDLLDKQSRLPSNNSLPEFHKEVVTA